MSLPSFSPLGGKGEEEEGLGRRHVCYRRGQRSGLQPKCYVWHAAEAPVAVAPALSVSFLRNAALALKGTCNGKIGQILWYQSVRDAHVAIEESQ